MIPFPEYLWAFVERFLGLLRSNTNSKGPFPPTRCLRGKDVAPAIEMQLAGVRSQPNIEKLESEVKRLMDDVKSLTEEVERKTAACASLQRKLEAQDNLLQTRQAELREAQAYSGIVDRLSDMDVLRTLDALNAEILQAAAHIVDEFKYQDAAPTAAARDDAKEILGAAVVKMLFAVGKGRCSEYVVQLALQAAYVQFARGVVESWSATSTQHTALKEAHEGIFLAETQSVSAKWKILTRCYTRHLRSDAASLERRLIEITSHVLEIAGVRWDAISEEKNEKLREEAGEVVALVKRLQEHVGEGISSSDLSVIVPRVGDAFDAGTMEDENARAGDVAIPTAAVLVVTKLGLLRREQTKRFGETESRVVVSVLKRAAVMLDDLVGELMEEDEVGEDID